MDPATIAMLIQIGVPVVTALLGVVAKHYLPTLGNAVLPGGASKSPTVPLIPALPGSPTPAMPAIAGRHPLLARLLGSANGQGFLNELLTAAEQTALSMATQPASQPATVVPVQSDLVNAILAAIAARQASQPAGASPSGLGGASVIMAAPAKN